MLLCRKHTITLLLFLVHSRSYKFVVFHFNSIFGFIVFSYIFNCDFSVSIDIAIAFEKVEKFHKIIIFDLRWRFWPPCVSAERCVWLFFWFVANPNCYRISNQSSSTWKLIFSDRSELTACESKNFFSSFIDGRYFVCAFKANVVISRRLCWYSFLAQAIICYGAETSLSRNDGECKVFLV